MFIDGLGYFVMLTAINIANAIFWKTAPIMVQSAASSLGYAITMIAAQRILIHLRSSFTEPFAILINADRLPKDIADNSSMPKLPALSVPDMNTGHDVAFRITIQRDIEAHTEPPDMTKSAQTIQPGRKNPTSYGEMV